MYRRIFSGGVRVDDDVGGGFHGLYLYNMIVFPWDECGGCQFAIASFITSHISIKPGKARHIIVVSTYRRPLQAVSMT